MCHTSSTSPRGVYTARVTVNETICAEHGRLVLQLDRFPPSRAGQFVQLQCRPLQEQVSAAEVHWPDDRPPTFTQPELTDDEPMLRRPFSLAGRTDTPAGVELEIIYRVVGTGTRWLSRQQTPFDVSLLGPLGNGFALPSDGSAVLVGGGVGIPPMLYLADALAAAGCDATAILGARSAHLLPVTLTGPADPQGRPEPCCKEFATVGLPVIVTTDDGTAGMEGFVTDALIRHIKQAGLAHDALTVFSCGPEPMMRAVGDLCIELGIACQLSLERHMACGMGTCQSCVVKIRDDSPAGWSYKLCCTHGPVFQAGDVLW
jgi:dihydroorotate dehydrogenase electron transfer subunit